MLQNIASEEERIWEAEGVRLAQPHMDLTAGADDEVDGIIFAALPEQVPRVEVGTVVIGSRTSAKTVPWPSDLELGLVITHQVDGPTYSTATIAWADVQHDAQTMLSARATIEVLSPLWTTTAAPSPPPSLPAALSRSSSPYAHHLLTASSPHPHRLSGEER